MSIVILCKGPGVSSVGDLRLYVHSFTNFVPLAKVTCSATLVCPLLLWKTLPTTSKVTSTQHFPLLLIIHLLLVSYSHPCSDFQVSTYTCVTRHPLKTSEETRPHCMHWIPFRPPLLRDLRLPRSRVRRLYRTIPCSKNKASVSDSWILSCRFYEDVLRCPPYFFRLFSPPSFLPLHPRWVLPHFKSS